VNPAFGTPETQLPFLQDSETAEAIWLLAERNVILAAGDRTGERLAVVEHEARRGWSPPWHRQPDEDETFYVLAGELSFWAGNPDEPVGRAGTGTLAFLPRGIPHSFRVESETARWLTISTPAGHERFYQAAGEPMSDRYVIPDQDAGPDLERLRQAAARYGVELLGPPPAS